ncbi:MAG: RNA 2'-phosphotransferase [Fimbriiglobus sp.]
MAANLVKLSKFLSLVLRHEPEAIGLTLDEAGWASVEELIRLANSKGTRLTGELLRQIVAESDKQRFAFSEDGLKIRANQGHSVEVNLDLPPVLPPEFLYHGTATRFVESIRATGLNSGSRQHVHLSADVPTATTVGQRHGKPAVLTIRAQAMHQAQHLFWLSKNGVWLVNDVPPEFIDFPEI